MLKTIVSAVSTAKRLYNPLPPGYIRLLHLEGLCMAEVAETGRPDFAIKCRLEPVPFKLVSTEDPNLNLRLYPHLSPPSYTALSYCWGNTSPAFGRLVVCNGVTVTITSNLFNALHQFVLDDDPDKKTLWVDALCINQDDLSEKSYQVAMMGDIYYSANLVLAWLGIGSDSAGDSLCQFWKAIDDRPVPDFSDAECIKSELQPRSKRRQIYRNETYARPSLSVAAEEEGRRYVESSTWFKRSWTFQEAVLAREMLVQCGRFCTPWKTFCSVKGIDVLCANINVARKMTTRRSLLDLFILTGNRHATDLRDKVYSLLGLYQGSYKLRADYSLSTKSVHAMAMKAILDEQGYLFFLHLYYSSMLKTLKTPYGMLSYLGQPHDRVSAPRLFGPQAFKARGFSWIPNWSLFSSRRFMHASVLLYCERGHADFRRLNKNWAMNYSLRGSNLRVAGGLLGVKFEGADSDEMIYHLGRSCTSLVRFSHIYTNLDEVKSGWLQNTAMQDNKGFFDSNKLYEATVFSHFKGVCSCAKENVAKHTSNIEREVNSIGRAERREANDAEFFSQHEDGLDVPACFDIPTDPSRKRFLFVATLFGFPAPVLLKPRWDPRKKEVTFALAGFVIDFEIQNIIKQACSGETPPEVPKLLRWMNGDDDTTIMFKNLSWIPTHFELV